MTTAQTAQQPPPAETPPSRRRLDRSRDDRVVAGVCGGIARFFDVDVTLVRVGAVVSVGFGGIGLLAYVAAVLLVPEQGAGRPLLSGGAERRRGLALAAAAAFGAIVLLSLAAIGDVGWGIGPGWPLVLLASGGALLYFLHERDRPEVAPDAPGAGPATPPRPDARPPAVGPADAPTAADPADAPTPADPANAPTLTDPAEAPTAADADAAPTPADPAEAPTVADPPAAAAAVSGLAAGPPLGPPPPARADGDSEPAPRSDRGSWVVTLFATGGVLVGLAVAGLLDAFGAVDLGWGAFAAIAIVLTGVALVASAFFGGARGLIPVGLLLTLALGTTAAAGVSLDGGFGTREHRVLDAAGLRDRYEVAVGRIELDLRALELPAGVTRIAAEVDLGQLRIVASEATVVGGDVDARGDGEQRAGGIDVDREIALQAGDGRLVIDAHVGVGMVVVSDRPTGRDGWSDASGSPRAAPAAAPVGLRCAPGGFAFAAACPAGDGDGAA